MQKYRKITQIAYAAMVVATIWLFSPAMAGSGDPEVAKQAWPLIEAGALLIDVRTQEEWDEGHIDGATHLTSKDTDSIMAAIGSDKDRQVVLYCGSGKRAENVKTVLEQAGYTQIFNATGFEALQSTHP